MLVNAVAGGDDDAVADATDGGADVDDDGCDDDDDAGDDDDVEVVTSYIAME